LDTSRVSLGEMIAAAGGLVLLVCMFVPWFDGTASGRGATNVPFPTTTGWEAYGGVFDLLIVLLAALPIFIAIARANDSLPPLPLEQGTLVLGAGILLVAIVALRLIDPPDPIDVEIPGLVLDTSRKLAGFLAALCAVAVAVGGYAQARER
jgi:hypothetical protein